MESQPSERSLVIQQLIINIQQNRQTVNHHYYGSEFSPLLPYEREIEIDGRTYRVIVDDNRPQMLPFFPIFYINCENINERIVYYSCGERYQLLSSENLMLWDMALFPLHVLYVNIHIIFSLFATFCLAGYLCW